MAIDNRENWYHLYDVREQFIFKMTKEKWDPPPPNPTWFAALASSSPSLDSDSLLCT